MNEQRILYHRKYIPMVPPEPVKPVEVWLNEYAGGHYYYYDSAETARNASGTHAIRTAVHFREVVEEPAPPKPLIICKGCGRKMLPGNSWMVDGCPCNSSRGVNDGVQCPMCQQVRRLGSCDCRANTAGEVIAPKPLRKLPEFKRAVIRINGRDAPYAAFIDFNNRAYYLSAAGACCSVISYTILTPAECIEAGVEPIGGGE